MKKLILFLFTIITICIVVNYVSHIITFKQFSIYSKNLYYKENVEYDIIFTGSSQVFYGISPLYLFNKYGLSSYNLSAPVCPYNELYGITKEMISLKKPNVIIVDYNSLLLTGKTNMFSIGNISSIRNFYIRFQTYLKNYNYKNALDNSNLYNLFHTRWKDLTSRDFYTDDYLRGYSSEAYAAKPEFTYENKPYELSDIQKKQIDEYIKLLEKNNIKLVIIVLPRTFYFYTNSKNAQNALKSYISKYNVDFIDVSDLSLYNLETDFQSKVHLNFNGGKKLMNRQDFIPYIMKKYNLSDHRHEKKYAQWHKDYIKQERMINGEELKFTKNFNTWWELAVYDNYTIMLSINGDNVLNRLPKTMKDKFKTLGLNKFETDKKNQKYAAIIDSNQVFFEEVSDNRVEYKGRMKNIVNLLISSEPNKATINVSGKPRAKNRYGINFVIYDKVNREVVDSIWVDPAKPDEVKR